MLNLKLVNWYISIILLFLSCTNTGKDSEKNSESKKIVPIIHYAVLKIFPHDTNSFTEGLLIHNNKIFESTGSPEELPATSSLFGILDTTTGKILTKSILDKNKFFGEGIAVLNENIYQLTYKSQLGFVYDSKSFQKIKEFRFPNKEGWGLATNGELLIISDGTSKLTFLSPDDFSVQIVLNVFDVNGGVTNLNELEFIKGFIYANVYMTNKIVKIDPISGEVIGQFDMSSLYVEAKNKYAGALEMNGIAYDTLSKTMFVTGKMWPNLYQITFSH